jgi:hypothetical protein
MPPDDDKLSAKAKLRPRNVRISARVYRAAEGRWEDLGTISTTHLSWGSRVKEVIRRWLQFLRRSEKNG